MGENIKKIYKSLLIILFAAFVVVYYQNCSNVNFETVASLVPFCQDLEDAGVKPILKYAWRPTEADSPQFNQVMSSPAVGDLDHDGYPEIVFTTFSTDSTSWYPDSEEGTALYNRNGVLRVIDGRTGATKFSVGDTLRAPIGDTMPLLIDIDHDGKAEIIYLHYTRRKVVALNYDGNLRWSIEVPYMACVGGLSAIDLDHDGHAQIIANNIIIQESADKKPSIRMSLPDGDGRNCTSFAASLDPKDPQKISIVLGNGVYDKNGVRVFGLPISGFNAVADIRPDIDGLEIIQAQAGKLSMYNGLTGTAIFSKDLTEHTGLECPSGKIGGGPPTVGDFKGDGSIQIAIATGRSLTIFDSAGNPIAGSLTKDCSSLNTGITSYDFNGDGKPEIIYGDENYLRIYNMNSNSELMPIYEILNPSGTLLEYPVVVDVDGDHLSELVVVSNDYNVPSLYEDREIGEKARGITGVRVFEPQVRGSWMPTRSVWNQYAYFVNNVTDSLVATDATYSSNPELNRIFRRNTQGANDSLRCQNQGSN